MADLPNETKEGIPIIMPKLTDIFPRELYRTMSNHGVRYNRKRFEPANKPGNFLWNQAKEV